MAPDSGHSSPASNWQPTLGSYDAETNTVTLRGEWDFSSKGELRNLTDKLRPSYASIDLVDATFIDSSVLNEIVHTRNRLSASGGRLRIFVGEGHVARLLSITGLDQVLEVDRKTR
jgi:anti-sigma B factor antagonist